MTVVAALEPHDATTAAAMLADAARSHTHVFPEGNRTKSLGASVERGRPLSTRLLTTGFAHYAGDLVATIPAGMTLREANAAMARSRQWLPLDPRFSGSATIGGIVASNDSGPRRHRFGAPRDLVIGIEVALPGGQVARAGGRVVKNVAGYDLGRLFCGSRGSLGVITSVTFKLAPVSDASHTVIAHYDSLSAAVAAAVIINAAPGLGPSAVEIECDYGAAEAPHHGSDASGTERHFGGASDVLLLVRFESTERSAVHMASTARTLLAGDASEVTVADGEAEAALWSAHAEIESSTDGMLTSVSVLPTQVAAALSDIEMLATRFGLAWSLAGRVALGVLRVRTRGADAAQLQFAVALRTAIARVSGHVTLLAGPDGVLTSACPFGPPGSTASIALAVKQRFDPANILPYPWALI